MSSYIDKLTEAQTTLSTVEDYKKRIVDAGGLDTDTYTMLQASFGAEQFSEIDDRLLHDYPTATYESYAIGVLNKLGDQQRILYADMYDALKEKVTELYPTVIDVTFKMLSDFRCIKGILGKHDLSEVSISPSEKPVIRAMRDEDGSTTKTISLTMLPLFAHVESTGRLGKMPMLFNIDMPACGKHAIINTLAHQFVVGSIDIDELYYAYVNGVSSVPGVLYAELINSTGTERAINELVSLIRELQDIDYDRSRTITFGGNKAIDTAKAISVYEWLFAGDNGKRTKTISSNAVIFLEELLSYK